MTLTIIATKFLQGTPNASNPFIAIWKNLTKCLISVLRMSPDKTFNKTVDELRKALRKDLKSSPPGKDGFKLLLKYDKYSTRQFLAEYISLPKKEWIGGSNSESLSRSQQADPSTPDDTLPPFNYETIEFLETFNG